MTTCLVVLYENYWAIREDICRLLWTIDVLNFNILVLCTKRPRVDELWEMCFKGKGSFALNTNSRNSNPLHPLSCTLPFTNRIQLISVTTIDTNINQPITYKFKKVLSIELKNQWTTKVERPPWIKLLTLILNSLFIITRTEHKRDCVEN